MRFIRGAAAFVGATVLLAGCSSTSDEGAAAPSSSAPVVTINETPVDAKTAETLDTILGNIAKNSSEQFPALWVGAWDQEAGAYVRAWGEAEVGGAPATTEDVFRIGSVTKTMTATVLLQLVDQGKLGLEDTVAKAAPKVAEQHPEVGDLTIRQLLGMASGLPDYMNVPDGIVAGITKDPTTVWTSDQLIDAGIAGGVKPAGTSGYSTTNYIVAQQIAESITGKSIQDLIAEQLTGPLGMSTAALPPNDDTALPAPATHGYLNTLCAAEVAADGGTAPAGQDTADWNASYGQGGGGMHATLADLGRWGASELGSALLSDASAGERLKFTKLPEGIDYGLGLIDYGDGFLGHSGEALGWQAQVAHNPTTGLTVAMGTNACAGADGLMFDTVRAVLASTMNPPEGSMSPPEESAAPGTVVDVAASNEFKTLVAAVNAADLAETLSGEGPFTVFAPTDAAFEELPEGVLDALLLPENKDALTKILTYHVLEGEVMAADVTAGDVETVEGSTVTITTDGGVKVNDANVVVPDVDASNGVIHVIEAVLIPESVDVAALTS